MCSCNTDLGALVPKSPDSSALAHKCPREHFRTSAEVSGLKSEVPFLLSVHKATSSVIRLGPTQSCGVFSQTATS